MTKEAAISQLESTYDSICKMSELECMVWKSEQSKKEWVVLQGEYGIDPALILALFYFEPNAQRFYRLPICHMTDGLNRTKELFKQAVLRAKGRYFDKQLGSDETN
jgi:hypothetical protein